MLQVDFLNTNWKHHDIVKLTNGKEYVVQKQKKRYILLLSIECSAYFVADHNIIVSRTYESCHSTYEEALETDTLLPSHRALIEKYQANKDLQPCRLTRTHNLNQVVPNQRTTYNQSY